MEDYSVDIKNAVEVLKRGGIILYPTDTVWGIGCDASNPEAVSRVFALKQRNDAKAMITLVDSLAALDRIVEYVPDVAEQLIEVSDRPVSIVYDHGRNVAPSLLAADGSLAVRVTTETFSNTLCRRFGRPLVSTSANISGNPTPRSFAEIDPAIIEGVDYVCVSRHESQPATRPSMVIKISDDGVFKILRS